MRLKSFSLTSWSIYLGNAFEHYDKALFSLLSPLLAPLFFPHDNSLISLLMTYALFPLGMLARPLGSFCFGLWADKSGILLHPLKFSLIGMGLITICMGLLPTYSQIGFAAPLFFALGYALQNFFAAGETVGGALALLEREKSYSQDILSSFHNASSMIGILLASFLISAFSIFHISLNTGGWRVLYMFGGFTALFAALFRKSFSLPKNKQSLLGKSIFISLWHQRSIFFLIMIATGLSHANYVMAIVLLNGVLPHFSAATTEQLLNWNGYFLLIDLLALPLCGFLATRFTREKVMKTATWGILLCALPCFFLFSTAPWSSIVAMRILFVLIGVAFAAPFYAWCHSLVPEQKGRTTLIATSVALGNQLLGAPTALIATGLFHYTQNPLSLSWYWMGLALLFLFALTWQNKRARESLPIISS